MASEPPNRSEMELVYRSGRATYRRALRKGQIRPGCEEVVELMANLLGDCADEEALYPGGGASLFSDELGGDDE